MRRKKKCSDKVDKEEIRESRGNKKKDENKKVEQINIINLRYLLLLHLIIKIEMRGNLVTK